MPLLYACSSNAGKLREFTFAAQQGGEYEVQPLPGLAQIPPPEENGATYEANAELKALYYSGFTRELVFADDTGLEVAALNGAPGIISARFAGPAATAAQNSGMLLARMAGVAERQARFVTAISLAKAGRLLKTAVGTVAGQILSEPQGDLGFGYDPLFYFPPLQRTFSQLNDAQKFAVSARGEAFRQLFVWLAVESH